MYKAHNALKIMSITTLVLFLLLVGLLAFWRFYPYEPVTTGPKPYEIVYPPDKVIKQGGYLTYQFDYVKTSPVNATIRRQFVDGLVFNVAGDDEPTIFGVGEGTARAQVQVPETLPPGKYHLRIIATYEMNPIRNYINESTTEDFTVVAK